MKWFRLKIRRRTDETVRLMVEAESSAHAHKLGEATVRKNEHPSQSKRTEVSVLECHEEMGE